MSWCGFSTSDHSMPVASSRLLMCGLTYVDDFVFRVTQGEVDHIYHGSRISGVLLQVSMQHFQGRACCCTSAVDLMHIATLRA